MTMVRSSQAAIDLIINAEVSSKPTYQKLYQHPEWPGGASGVTIGIGYDCGYSTPDVIHSDWSGKLSSIMVEALESVSGIKGPPAQSHAHELRSVVTVPWDAAIAVFMQGDLPKWESIVSHALPNTDSLPDDCFGALVSLTYNRGASYILSGNRYEEMRNIRELMAAEQFDRIPDEFRSMKRLWPSVRGLRDRREREATLFEKGLATMSVPVA